MRWPLLPFCALMTLAWVPVRALAQAPAAEACPRPAAGSAISEPEDLRSQNGVLKVAFSYRNSLDASGRMHYCYLYKDGSQAPNLRLHPGDWLVLSLKNDLKNLSNSPDVRAGAMTMPMPGSCGNGTMDAWSTNLHFHGLSVPPVCHEDDVLKTLIAPTDPPFEYRFRIPPDEPPGLYWYHPHVHGFSSAQVLGGASGALIVEGVERANNLLAGFPERVLIVRDQDLVNPNAAPSASLGVQPPVLRDAEGDVMNTGTTGGKPAKDLSVNFVPVPYPDYRPATMAMKPGERQLWRVLNASAITYLDLQVLFDGTAQPLGLVSLDGVPINEQGMAGNRIVWKGQIALPPGGRAEFILKGPPLGAHASLITRSVDTGPAGENDPDRPLATILADADAPNPRSTLPAVPGPRVPQTSVWLGDVKPAHRRKLYFSERRSDPNDPNSPVAFFITVDGQDPVAYDPSATAPNIVVQQGDVEEWTIENRTRELHAFHIHQIHFMMTEWNGVPVDEPYLRDTINVSYWDGQTAQYPNVKLLMDFRDPNSVGTFVYHCHLLEHEDGGMMGTVRVEPREQSKSSRSHDVGKTELAKSSK